MEAVGAAVDPCADHQVAFKFPAGEGGVAYENLPYPLRQALERSAQGLQTRGDDALVGNRCGRTGYCAHPRYADLSVCACVNSNIPNAHCALATCEPGRGHASGEGYRTRYQQENRDVCQGAHLCFNDIQLTGRVDRSTLTGFVQDCGDSPRAGPSGPGPSGSGPSGSGPSGPGPSGSGPSGPGPSGPGAPRAGPPFAAGNSLYILIGVLLLAVALAGAYAAASPSGQETPAPKKTGGWLPPAAARHAGRYMRPR